MLDTSDTEVLSIRPAAGYLVAEPMYQTTTKGGLEIPEHIARAEDSYKPVRLRVLAVGPPRQSEKTGTDLRIQCKVGDIVYPGGPGFKWDIDGRELWVMDDAMVVAFEESDA
jgi:co-chaperonin GroES (HSP10)